MPTLLYVVAVVAVAILAFSLYRKLTRDHIDEINKGRRGSARIVGRGEYVDGNRHLEVALALSDTTFFYENPDMQASLDLEWIREVEYDDELSTGAAVENGSVLRLRTDSQSFEFVLPREIAADWKSILAPRAGAQASSETERNVVLAE